MTETGRSDAVELLIVEDDRVEVKAMMRALAQRGVGNPVRVASDGVEALSVLRGSDGVEPIRKPYLILLDLNMPRMGGLDFLRRLRSDEDHRDAVVFVLTTSSEEEDKIAAYGYNVAGYIVKSDYGEGFGRVIDLIQTYGDVVELPR